MPEKYVRSLRRASGSVNPVVTYNVLPFPEILKMRIAYERALIRGSLGRAVVWFAGGLRV